MSQETEQVTVRRNTFFCINKERHAKPGQIVEEVAKEIEVFGRKVRGWLVTTESPVIEQVISIDESLEEQNKLRDLE